MQGLSAAVCSFCSFQWRGIDLSRELLGELVSGESVCCVGFGGGSLWKLTGIYGISAILWRMVPVIWGGDDFTGNDVGRYWGGCESRTIATSILSVKLWLCRSPIAKFQFCRWISWPDFWTGCVKVTPAHDPNDFEMGKRHTAPFINIMNKDGTFKWKMP
jgi:hypothetical protein